ncbi:MAG: L-seryl-tRNA(Sec) selenium transferase, partial [bacterium]|nr:L-seryl-tRNA(Sec) selenium transferase [bacterium]
MLELVDKVGQRVLAKRRPSLRRVINATGVPLHTNLGRAPLAEEALEAIIQVAKGYSTLEYDLTNGTRGSRQDHISSVLSQITGAEDAIVVNNNAAAVLIVLSALAKGKEVIVSRGQLVEVGGSFRIPEVMEQGGAILKEVGTTNKTHPVDYLRAISEKTALLLKVHTSNYRVVGFTSEVSTGDLVHLAHQNDLLAIEDLGSGILVGGFGEPTVQESIAAGMDIVTFSGDKLLGGPQAGLIVGKKSLIEQIRHHPLARALRVDKMTLAALEVTLKMYKHQEKVRHVIPILKMISYNQTELKAMAEDLAVELGHIEQLKVKVFECAGVVGGGSLPTVVLPGYAVALDAPCSATELERRLRFSTTPIIARILHDHVVLDPRTILPQERAEIVKLVRLAIAGAVR